MKIRKRLGNFHFKRGGLPYYGVVRKFSFSWGLSVLGVEVEGGGVISQEVSTLHTITQEEQPSDKGRQEFTQVEWGAHFCIKQGGQALRRAAHYMGGESKKLGYIEEVLSHAPPTMINPGNNQKVGEIGTSWVFSLRNQVDAIFKNNQ